MKGLIWAMTLVLAISQLPGCRARPAPTPTSRALPTSTPITASSPSPAATPTADAPATPTPAKRNFKVVFHPDYLQVYSSEPAAASGRLEAIVEALQDSYVFVRPEPAREEDLRRVHTQRLIDEIKTNPQLNNVARLAAGGAILAAELAAAGEVAFGLIRPVGHHASPDSHWGYAYFNNIAVALEKLMAENKIQRPLIVDFDLHFGDGTYNIFRNDSGVLYYHVSEEVRALEEFQVGSLTSQEVRELELGSLEGFLNRTTGYDILAVSAGFDSGKEDWGGGMFEMEDFRTIGKLLKEAALRNSGGKRFAVLEGGYNQDILGKNVRAFLEGFE